MLNSYYAIGKDAKTKQIELRLAYQQLFIE